MVEFALVLPLLMTLALGIFSFGSAYTRQIALTSASRDASRFGATLTIPAATDGTTAGWLRDVATVAEHAATGDLAHGSPGRRICVAFVHPSGTEPGDVTTRLVRTDGGDVISNPAGSNACYDAGDGRPAGERRVQVTVERQTVIEALVFTRVRTLTARSVTIYESSR